MLCALYQGLFQTGVKEKELRRWQKEGRLVDEIKAAFETLPPGNRGEHYRWFLDHQWVLDGSTLQLPRHRMEEMVAQAKTMVRDGWVAIGGSPNDDDDDIKAQLGGFSPNKHMCFQLYFLLLDESRPIPSMETWLAFGFVAASSPREEHHWALKYADLIKRCTFSEFCVAYETSSMVALFSKHGFLTPSACFHDVMSGSPTRFKSVWNLKQYIDDLICYEPGIGEPPQLTRPFSSDYGFENCKDASERKLLNDMYTHLFRQPGVNPLALHEACMKGKVFGFVKGLVKLPGSSAEYKRLLKNPHPLPDVEALNI